MNNSFGVKKYCIAVTPRETSMWDVWSEEKKWTPSSRRGWDHFQELFFLQINLHSEKIKLKLSKKIFEWIIISINFAI